MKSVISQKKFQTNAIFLVLNKEVMLLEDTTLDETMFGKQKLVEKYFTYKLTEAVLLRNCAEQTIRSPTCKLGQLARMQLYKETLHLKLEVNCMAMLLCH
jgi:hypothetical protein